jgi:hypothetical protein
MGHRGFSRPIIVNCPVMEKHISKNTYGDGTVSKAYIIGYG